MKLYKKPTANNDILNIYEDHFLEKIDKPQKVKKIQYYKHKFLNFYECFPKIINYNLVLAATTIILLIIVVSHILIISENIEKLHLEVEENNIALSSILIYDVLQNKDFENIAHNLYVNANEDSRPEIRVLSSKFLLLRYPGNKEITLAKETNSDTSISTKVKITNVSNNFVPLITDKIDHYDKDIANYTLEQIKNGNKNIYLNFKAYSYYDLEKINESNQNIKR